MTKAIRQEFLFMTGNFFEHVDKEAVAAGFTGIIRVTSSGKGPIENYYE